jgi:hypothetical protein
MLKQLTFKGKHSAGNPDKLYWASKTPVERLAAAND